MPPRRNATSRKVQNPATRKRSATSTPSSNMRHDSGADDVNQENHARKRQRMESDHHHDAVSQHEPPSEIVQAAVAEPLSDASNVVAPPTSGRLLAHALNHPWPGGQSLELQGSRANVSIDIGGHPTQALAPVAGPSHGQGSNAPEGPTIATDDGLYQLGITRSSTNDRLGWNQQLDGLPYDQDLSAIPYDGTSVEQGIPGPSIPAHFDFAHTYGLGGMAFEPLDDLAPLLQAAAEDIARAGPPMGDLAGTMGDSLLFAGGLPFAGDDGLQVASDQDQQLLDSVDTLGQPEPAVDQEDDLQSAYDGTCDPSMLMGSPRATFGLDVQAHNTDTPQAQSQPEGSGAQASGSEKGTQMIPDATEESSDEEEEEADGASGYNCAVCGARFDKRPALRNHTMRNHNRFRRNFGDKFPCAMCGVDRVTICEQYQRHWTGKGVTQCPVVAAVHGDYGALMRRIVGDEIAKGDDGKGLECLAHWQFGSPRARCFQGLCKAWHQERTAQGELWHAMKKYGDRIPIMDLFDEEGEGEGKPKMKWAATGKFYEPGTEPGVAETGKGVKKNGGRR